MLTTIVSSGSMIVSVNVCTSIVALEPLLSVTTGVTGTKSTADVAVPAIVNGTWTSPPASLPLSARVTFPPSATVAVPVIVTSGSSPEEMTVLAVGLSPRS